MVSYEESELLETPTWPIGGSDYMKLSLIRVAAAALPLTLVVQLGLSQMPPPTLCPTSDVVPCNINEAVKEAWGCGTYGVACCAYTIWRCPGSSTTYTVWTEFFGLRCERNLVGEYWCS